MLIPNTKLMMVDAQSCYYAKFDPTKPKGDDAHFICREKQVIGVADGVGGLRKRNIDAGEFARELMKNAEHFVSQAAADVDPMLVLFNAFFQTKKIGASTACILALNGNRLRAANMGDSGFLVIRGGKTIYRSPVQQYKFNMPYQLSHIPPKVEGPMLAANLEVKVESGDIIVAATDGLFDNLFPIEIDATVARCLKNGGSTMAMKLAMAAYENSIKSDFVSPFAKAAKKAGKLCNGGGKRDDITVVVASVVEDLQ